jgi:hypothetical protein
LFLAGCSGQAANLSAATATETAAATPTPTETAAPTPSPTATPAATPKSTTYAIGDEITITQDGDPWANFTVVEVRQAKEFADPDGFYNDTPQTAGYVYVAANVKYEAIVDGVDYNPFDFQIFVADKAVDNVAFAINGPKPELSSGTLPKGRTAEGWLLYEVPPTGKVVLSYTGNMFANDAPVFEVVLRKS